MLGEWILAYVAQKVRTCADCISNATGLRAVSPASQWLVRLSTPFLRSWLSPVSSACGSLLEPYWI